MLEPGELDVFLAELYARGEREGGMWNVGPEGGAFLAWLVGLLDAQRVLEIGTSNGYSTIWLARALARTGGGLVTLEVDPRKVELAKENLAAVGLDRLVTVVQGPAMAALPVMTGPFALVFIDADKSQYVDYLREVRRLVAPGSVIVADNMTTHPDETAPYREAALADPGLESITLPVAGGFFVSRVTR